MRLIVGGILLMLAGLSLLFAMVTGFLATWLLLSLFAFVISFAGLLLGLAGLAQKLRRRQ